MLTQILIQTGDTPRFETDVVVRNQHRIAAIGKRLSNTNIIACCTTAIKAEYVKDNPMPQLKHEDYATWLNILKNHQIEAECIPGNWSVYRKVKGSVSSNKLRTIAWNWNIYRNNQKLGFFRSVKQILTFICMTGYKYIKR